MSSFQEVTFDKPLDGPEQKVESATFYITGSQSRITKYGKFTNLKKIQVVGKSVIEHNTTLRGDLAKIKIGYYAIIGEGTILKPSEKFGESVSFLDMSIGDYTVIGKNCVIRAWTIGCCCWIGEGCVINNRCVLEDCGMVLPNSVLAPGTIVPPYTVFSGNPARLVGRLPPTFDMLMNEHTHAFYKQFKAVESDLSALRSRGGGGGGGGAGAGLGGVGSPGGIGGGGSAADTATQRALAARRAAKATMSRPDVRPGEVRPAEARSGEVRPGEARTGQTIPPRSTTPHQTQNPPLDKQPKTG